MSTFVGAINVGFAESTAQHPVKVEILGDECLGTSASGKVEARILSPTTSIKALAVNFTPLWFGLDGDNKAYRIRVFEDATCEISWNWNK